MGHTNFVYCLQALPTGELASGSNDQTIKIWNLETERYIKTLRGHKSAVFCLQVTNNGILVSGSQDQTIKCWEVKTG